LAHANDWDCVVSVAFRDLNKVRRRLEEHRGDMNATLDLMLVADADSGAPATEAATHAEVDADLAFALQVSETDPAAAAVLDAGHASATDDAETATIASDSAPLRGKAGRKHAPVLSSRQRKEQAKRERKERRMEEQRREAGKHPSAPDPSADISKGLSAIRI